jgi:hypothetical protein
MAAPVMTTAAKPTQPAENAREECAHLLRGFVFEVLGPVGNDSDAARSSLANNDDVGARYHLQRVVSSVKAAAATFRELEELKAHETAVGGSAA